MGDFHQILMEMYPTPNEEIIPEKRPIFSVFIHANKNYSVNPRANILNIISFYALVKLWEATQLTLNIPLDQVMHVSNVPLAVRPLSLGVQTALTEAMSILLIYADKWMKNAPTHEKSHSYRSRFLDFMKKLKIQKTVYENGEEVKITSEYQGGNKGLSHKYLSFIDRLENMAKEDSIKGSLAREAAVVLSIPYLFCSFLIKRMSFSYKIDETLAKYEAEILTGIPGSKISEKTRHILACLYGLRTDEYVPLNSMEKIRERINSSNLSEQYKNPLVELQELEINDIFNASPGFKFYLEHPPIILPKYSQLENILSR